MIHKFAAKIDYKNDNSEAEQLFSTNNYTFWRKNGQLRQILWVFKRFQPLSSQNSTNLSSLFMLHSLKTLRLFEFVLLLLIGLPGFRVAQRTPQIHWNEQILDQHYVCDCVSNTPENWQ